MLTNRTTLAQIGNMEDEQLAKLDVAQLAMLLEDAAAIVYRGQTHLDQINRAIALRYGVQAATKRAQEGKDTGRVSLVDGEYVVKADLPKKVTWDDTLLAQAIAQIAAWGENVSEYVTTKHVVAETKFNAWPSTIRRVFEAARCVGVGKPTFKIEKKAAA